MGQSELQKKIITTTIDFFKQNKLGYLDVAMRVGKTRIATEIFKHHEGEILITYPDNKLKDSWMSEFKKWEFNSEKVTLVNFSSLKNYINSNYTILCIDEWHSLSEKELEYVKEISNNSLYTLGLSGTVSNNTKNKWIEFKEIYKYSTQDGIEDGILADYQITVHFVHLDQLTLVKDSKGKMKSEKQRYDGYSWVIDKIRREGKSTMFMALARNRLSQSSIGKLNYLKKLLGELSDKRVLVFTGLAKVADSIGIPSYHSKSKDDETFKRFQSGEENHLALAAMGKVGVTYPQLDCVILINFTYNAEESSQILNRAIKLDYADKVADLHVIALKEPAEVKKIKESLSMLDQKKIKYV
jgi:superfamily II DNA or RNA helicase